MSDKVCKVLYAPVASRKLLESRHAVDPESLSHDGQLLLSWGSSTDCSDLTSTGINGHKVPVFYTPHDQHALEEVPGAHIEQFLPEIVPFFKRNIGERNPKCLHIETSVKTLLKCNNRVERVESFVEEVVLVGGAEPSWEDTDVIRSAEIVSCQPSVVKVLEVCVLPFLDVFSVGLELIWEDDHPVSFHPQLLRNSHCYRVFEPRTHILFDLLGFVFLLLLL